jgi:pantoate--beta-alanine ligase
VKESLVLPAVATTINEVRFEIKKARAAKQTIGLVPTMGGLHAGHASLIRAARTNADCTVVSLFINPTQFGPNEDLGRYPQSFDADHEFCGAVGADLLFAPSASEMYPEGFSTFVDVGGLGDHLCGASRPGHFRGVATVVLKLFNIVVPDMAIFGQKDAQQARIIQQMVRDLNLQLRIIVAPTVREHDGLAMSTRNRYLDPQQRAGAVVLHRALEKATALVAGGETSAARIEALLAQEVASTRGARLDYARVVDNGTLQPIEALERPALAALAVFFGTTRLIDNTILTPSGRRNNG